MAVISLRRVAEPVVGHIPVRILFVSAVASVILVSAAHMQDYPLYVVALFGLAPWGPVLVAETLWQYRHYHWLAAFFVVTVLQVGHLGEHSVQITQLFLNDGRLVHSHGVFGQLDFETVHFFWDSAVWLGTLLLVYRFGRKNGWLWVSLLFASLHEVEHMYLYYVNLFEMGFYHDHGGFAGILGKGGVLPTVSRPYLHFGYNFMVVVPMVIAYCYQLATSLGAVERQRGEAAQVGAPATG